MDGHPTLMFFQTVSSPLEFGLTCIEHKTGADMMLCQLWACSSLSQHSCKNHANKSSLACWWWTTGLFSLTKSSSYSGHVSQAILGQVPTTSPRYMNEFYWDQQHLALNSRTLQLPPQFHEYNVSLLFLITKWLERGANDTLNCPVTNKDRWVTGS